MSQPFPEDNGVRSAEPLRLFRSAFGETSLVLCGVFMLICWLQGFLARSAKVASEVDASALFYLSLVVVLACGAVSVAAVVYGVLAVFGFGKSKAKNGRLQGAIGATLGALFTIGLILLQIMASSPRLAIAEKAVLWPFVHESTGLVLNQPAQYWVVNVGEDAKRFDAKAVAVAAGPTLGAEIPDLLLVLESPVPGSDAGEIDYQRFGEALAAQNTLKDKAIERVETIEVASKPAAVCVVSGEVPSRGYIRHHYASLVLGETCMQLLLVTDKSNADGDVTFDKILRSVEFR